MPFAFTPLALPEVVLVEPLVRGDERGYFLESYKHSEFAAAGIGEIFSQVNHSHSIRGVLRGLHYQKPPMAQAKLLMVTYGEIFDVAVDIRHGSPTFGRWVGERLSSENHRALYVPVGFAHGFCVLSEAVDLVYLVSAEFSAPSDRGIRWDDPDIGIPWPLEAPLLSPKDMRHPLLREAEPDFVFGGS